MTYSKVAINKNEDIEDYSFYNESKILDLNHRNYSNEHMRLINFNNKSIEKLDLTGNEIESLDGVNLPPLLRCLDLACNKIESLDEYQGFPDSLEKISIESNGLRSMKNVKWPSNLKFFHADCNEIKDLKDLENSNFPFYKQPFIRLDLNPLAYEKFSKLKRYYPFLEITGEMKILKNSSESFFF